MPRGWAVAGSRIALCALLFTVPEVSSLRPALFSHHPAPASAPSVGGSDAPGSVRQQPAERRSRTRRHKAGRRRQLEGDGTEGEGAEGTEEEVAPTWAYVMGIAGTAVTFIIGHQLEHSGVTWVPEAAVGLMIGFLIAAFATEGWIGPLAFPWAHHMRFDYEFFMTFLLPPIIFEAGYNMQVRPFFTNIGPTIFFAFVGTFLSTFVVGGLVWYAGQLGLCYPLGMLASLTFGSLISATDPVTVLAVFQALGVKVDLFSMVFGESVLNDAVAIVLSRTLLSFNEPGATVDADSIAAAVVSFFVIFVGSSLIGVVSGTLCSLTYKYLGLRLHEEHLFIEGALSFIFPWAAYYTAEALELSGSVQSRPCVRTNAAPRPHAADTPTRLILRLRSCRNHDGRHRDGFVHEA